MSKLAKSSFVIAFSLLLLGQFTAIAKVSGTNLYFFDIFITSFGFLLAGYLFIKQRLILSSPHFYFFVFLCVGLGSLFLSASHLGGLQLATAIFYAVRFLGYLSFAISFYSITTNAGRQFILKASLKLILVFCILGFFQLALLDDFTVLDASLGWDPHKGRLASTFFDPNFAGGIIVLGLALSAYSYLENIISKRFLLFCLLLLLVSVILTFSRSAWLMLGVFTLFVGVFKYPKLLLLGLVIAFMAYAAVPRIQTRLSGITDPSDSAAFRLVSWKASGEVIYTHPFIGVGYNAYRYAQEGQGLVKPGEFSGNSGAGSDSSILFVLATTGVVGLAAYLFGWLMVGYSVYRKSPHWFIPLGVFAGLQVQALFINALFYPPIMFLTMFYFMFVKVKDSDLDKLL